MSTRKTKFPDVKKQYKDRSTRNTRKSSPEIIDINKTQLRVILKESTDTISESKLQFPPKPTL